MNEIEVGWDEAEGMYYSFCSTCDSEVFAVTEDDATEAGDFHVEHGHVWEYDMEDAP